MHHSDQQLQYFISSKFKASRIDSEYNKEAVREESVHLFCLRTKKNEPVIYERNYHLSKRTSRLGGKVDIWAKRDEKHPLLEVRQKSTKTDRVFGKQAASWVTAAYGREPNRMATIDFFRLCKRHRATRSFSCGLTLSAFSSDGIPSLPLSPSLSPFIFTARATPRATADLISFDCILRLGRRRFSWVERRRSIIPPTWSFKWEGAVIRHHWPLLGWRTRRWIALNSKLRWTAKQFHVSIFLISLLFMANN